MFCTGTCFTYPALEVLNLPQAAAWFSSSCCVVLCCVVFGALVLLLQVPVKVERPAEPAPEAEAAAE
jgi:hypothetical protein